MKKLAHSVTVTVLAILASLAALRPAEAADLTIVVVPQGLILETQLARKTPVAARAGTTIDFVVTHDLRVGDQVVIPAGSHGMGHLVRAGRSRGAARAPHVRYGYVLASDGTRIPVAGSLPYLTTRESRPVVIYGVADADRQTSAVPRPDSREASLTRP